MAMFKYEVFVMDAGASKEREEIIWELGRGGWELVSVLAGDWKKGEPQAPKMTWFVKREATHDIDF